MATERLIKVRNSERGAYENNGYWAERRDAQFSYMRLDFPRGNVVAPTAHTRQPGGYGL